MKVKEERKGNAKKKGRGLNSIKAKLNILIIGLSVVSALVISIITISVTSSALDDVVKDELTTLAVQSAETMEVSIDSSFRFLEGIAGTELAYDQTQDPAEQKKKLTKIAAENNVSDISFINAEGQTLAKDGVN